MTAAPNPRDLIEPAARDAMNAELELAPSVAEVGASIAISLKRIADALDGTTLGVDITDSLAGLPLRTRQ